MHKDNVFISYLFNFQRIIRKAYVAGQQNTPDEEVVNKRASCQSLRQNWHQLNNIGSTVQPT